jgi:hypothetical protein
MKWIMRKLPFFLGLLFVTITVNRIASFMGGGYSGNITAIALASAVYVSAYYVAPKTTRKPAIVCLIVFGFFDCIFNFGETMKWSVDTGRWAFRLDIGTWNVPIYQIADIAYGIFPTVAAAMLAYLARSVESIPLPIQRKSVAMRTQSVADASENEVELTHFCEYCKKGFGSRFSLSAHLRGCKDRKASQQVAIATQSEEIATNINGHHK